MIVVVCPGQGSQTPGFLQPWLVQEGAAQTLAEYSEAAEVDLVAAGTEWDADAIRQTGVAQPLIVAASLLTWQHLPHREAVGGVAGHSVGELAALAISGVIDPLEAMRLVGIRGRAMADAAAREPSGMSAVVGGDEQSVLERLTALGLTPANYNGGGQIVAAGGLPGLAQLAADPPRGSRVIALQVAGAFHSPYMTDAVAVLREAVGGVAASSPRLTLWSNHDGRVIHDGAEAIELLVGQVASPVRWDLCMADFSARGVAGLVELAPAGTLTGLAKRALRGTPAVAVKTPDDLESAAALLSKEPA